MWLFISSNLWQSLYLARTICIIGCRSVVQLEGPDPCYNWGGPTKEGTCKSWKRHSTFNAVLKRPFKFFENFKFCLPFHCFFGNFFPVAYFCFFDPKNGFLDPNIWEKSPNNTEIGPNLTYHVFIGLVTGLAKAPFIF